MFFHFRSITPVNFKICMRPSEECCTCLLPKNWVETSMIINLREAAHLYLAAGYSTNTKHFKESRDSGWRHVAEDEVITQPLKTPENSNLTAVAKRGSKSGLNTGGC